ncbi:MAG: response regulator [Patescibacteria group bacterium]|nr:response regulator [Patescibacteria group bacterium]
MSKILIIEDDTFLRELMKRKTQEAGFEVIESVDGESGVKAAKEQKPDLVLLDLILPGVNGFEVLAALKEDVATSDIPVLILSNLGQQEDIDKAMRLGAADFMIKAHFTPNEIVEKAKQILK